MGRRAQHTPEELKRLILDATRQIVEKGGASELSAREIARGIGYAPGTLYNLFKNLDEILYRVESELLDELDRSLAAALNGHRKNEAIRHFAIRYAEFAYDHAHLWQLIQTHQPQATNGGPDWYLEKLYAPAERLELLLSSLDNHLDIEMTTRTARVLWSAIHGVVQVATTEKFGALPRAATTAMVEDLVNNYLLGIAIGRNSQAEIAKRPRAKNSAQRHPD